jgi:DNA-binding transcriptional regulator PaaX
MSKYKYYFRKAKSEIVKDFLYWLMISGAVAVAAGSPYFGVNLWKAFKRRKKYESKKIYDVFYRLKRRNCIEIKNRGYQVYISLTEKGKKEAGWLQINALKIKKPKKWDKKWRIVIFDIAQLKKIQREAFRGKLKELGFKPLQKSVWIHPFDCKDEIELLKDFFGLTEKEVRLIVSPDIGKEKELRKIFRLS